MNKKDSKNSEVTFARLNFAFDSARAFLQLHNCFIGDPDPNARLCDLIKQTIDAMKLLKADLCTAIPLAEQELEDCLEWKPDPPK